MHRMEIYIDENQRDILRDIAHLRSKKEKKRVGISELIRDAVDMWINKEIKKIKALDETDFVLQHPDMLSDIKEAKRELEKGKLLTREEAFGKPEKV